MNTHAECEYLKQNLNGYLPANARPRPHSARSFNLTNLIRYISCIDHYKGR
jgi:hypothetical protein